MNKKKYCDLCHKEFKRGQERKDYIIYGYGIHLRIHKKCYYKVVEYCNKNKRVKIGRLIYGIFMGIERNFRL